MLGDELEDLSSAILSILLLDKVTGRDRYVKHLSIQLTCLCDLRL